MASHPAFKKFSHFITRGKRLPIVLGLACTLFVAVLQVGSVAIVNLLINNLEHTIYDMRFQIMPLPEKNPDNKIVIVDLDERSLQAEGGLADCLHFARFDMQSVLKRLTATIDPLRQKPSEEPAARCEFALAA